MCCVTGGFFSKDNVLVIFISLIFHQMRLTSVTGVHAGGYQAAIESLLTVYQRKPLNAPHRSRAIN